LLLKVLQSKFFSVILIASIIHLSVNSNINALFLCYYGIIMTEYCARTCPTDVSWFTLPEADDVAHISEVVECSDKVIISVPCCR
jgi:hypothetical protein